MSNKFFLTTLIVVSVLVSCTGVLVSCNGVKEHNCCADLVVSEDTVNVSIRGSIPVAGNWDADWINRYSDDVDALAAKAQADTLKTPDVVFFGSSSIRLWKDLDEMMAPLTVVNRGYGGATVRDILVNYDKIMAGYSPKAFVIFCDNDICGNKSVDLSVTGVLDYYRLLFNRLDKDYPGVPVFFLSWKYSGLRAFMRDTQRLVNEVMADYASTSPQVTFVDVNSALLRPDGEVNEDLFKSDHLHINNDGYLLWTSILKPHLMTVCNNKCE